MFKLCRSTYTGRFFVFLFFSEVNPIALHVLQFVGSQEIEPLKKRNQ